MRFFQQIKHTIQRFSMCLGILIIIQFPINLQIGLQTPSFAEVEHNQFHLPLSGLIERSSNIQRGETLGSIMYDLEIPQNIIQLASMKASSYIDLRKIRRGDPYYTYTDSTSNTTSFIVYQPSIEHFVVFDLRDSIMVHEDFLPISTITRAGSGTIETSLYQAVIDAGFSTQLAIELSEIFAWQISFFHLHPGDNFSVLFEDQVVNEQSIGMDIKGARMSHEGEDFFAFFFSEDSASGFYDETGYSLKRPFLRAPLNYYKRISSAYSPRRFHPIQKRYKPHLGTDFAAPEGTPIVATADGSVIKAAYTRGNGNYVKIRHNDIYITGYLHMSRIAAGIRPGVRVQQGQLIGYVGSTGMASGPHVCYRFWQNGRQVDAMKVTIPPSEPLSDELMPQFEQIINALKPQLMTEISANSVMD